MPMNKLDQIYSESLSINDYSKSYIDYLTSVLNSIALSDIEKFIEVLLEARERGSSIFFIGNGGSAANANHIANDLLIAAGKNSKRGIKVESLSSNSAVMTCLANDNGYENIFSEQIKKKGFKDDLLLVLSGSGNSKNIINAIKQAKKNKMHTFGILGFDGGKCKKILENHINFKINDMQISEDMQMIILNICLQELMKQKVKK